MNGRKGIAPVVATIILVLIVVVAAGGAFTWINDILQSQQDEGDEALAREVTVRDVQCAQGGNTVDYLLVNSGDIDLNADGVNVYVYNVSNSNLWGTGSLSEGTFSSGTQLDSITGGAGSVTVSGVTFQSPDPVTVQFEFTNEDGYTVSARCDPS